MISSQGSEERQIGRPGIAENLETAHIHQKENGILCLEESRVDPEEAEADAQEQVDPVDRMIEGRFFQVMIEMGLRFALVPRFEVSAGSLVVNVYVPIGCHAVLVSTVSRMRYGSSAFWPLHSPVFSFQVETRLRFSLEPARN